MGIEGERLVFDYLSRVGDLALSTNMTAAERAALVGRLRTEIGERRTAAGGAQSGAQVKRILGRIGRPEDVVADAAESGGRSISVPAPRPATEPSPAPTAPAAVSLDKPNDPVADDRYWPDGAIGAFTGGIEIPELLRPEREDAERPEKEKSATEAEDRPKEQEPGKEGKQESENKEKREQKEKKEKKPRDWRKLLRGALFIGLTGGPVELLAVILLAGGAIIGVSLYPLILGWLLCYWSPRLSRRAAQWATFGAPGVLIGAYVLWMAGRSDGFWGEQVKRDAAESAINDSWPLLLRAAALASAALLFYLARRPRQPAGS